MPTASARAERAGPGTPDRRRGSRALAVLGACAVVGVAGAGVAGITGAHGRQAAASPTITVRDADGQVLARAPLPDGRFAVRYRNSMYGTLAEQRYAVSGSGRFRLVELAADQLAVLEEYYAVPGPPRRASPADRRSWVAVPDAVRPATFARLSIAATDLGERTLLVPGNPPVALWRLVADDMPFVVLHIEEDP